LPNEEFAGLLILANPVSKLICFIQERKVPSGKNIAEYYLRKERAEWKEYFKILIKKEKSQIRRILQNINQEMK
jgi:hypothetical protein